MAVSVPFTGGCACGAIRYECSAAPVFMGNCHCRACQRDTGSAYLSMVVVPAASFTVTQGEPKAHERPSDSGNTTTMFRCPICSVPLYDRGSAMADILTISAGSLDDPSWYRPQADIWTASAQPADYMNPALPKFAHQPTAEETQELLSAKS